MIFHLYRIMYSRVHTRLCIRKLAMHTRTSEEALVSFCFLRKRLYTRVHSLGRLPLHAWKKTHSPTHAHITLYTLNAGHVFFNGCTKIGSLIFPYFDDFSELGRTPESKKKFSTSGISLKILW